MFGFRSSVPLARSEDLLIQPVGDEWVIYDEKTKEAHCLQPLVAKVFAHADGRTSVDRLATMVGEDLGTEVNSSDVLDAISALEERGLLVGPSRGVSRRDVIKTGAAVAVSAPLISSVFAAPAWAGASHTCGPLLCCPCLTSSGANANNCCFIQHVTANCQCTNAGGNSTKFCKPTGAGAPSDTYCAAHQPCCAACSNTQCGQADCSGVCNQIPCTSLNPNSPTGCTCAGTGVSGFDQDGNSVTC